MGHEMIELRPYQSDLVESVRDEIKQGKRRVLMVLPTGGGKTFIMSEIASRAVEKGNKVLCLMHRRQLVQQMQDRFADYGLECGVIMSGVDTALGCPVQIGTIQTYHRRLKLSDLDCNKFFIDASVIMIDEAHRSLSRTFLETLSNYTGRVVIGVTATPCLASGLGMGLLYESIVDNIGVQALIDQGNLVKAIYYAPAKIDLNGIRIVRGDYDIKKLGEKVNDKKLIGDIYENWARIAHDRQTIIFAVNVKHSKAIKNEFAKRGVLIEHLDAHSSEDERERVLKSFMNGDIQIVTNVGLYTEGFDYPGASAIVLARPTKSMGLYRQMAGRGLRPYPSKENCIIIDHGGCVEKLGFVEDDVLWSIDGKELAYKKKVTRKKEKTILTCEMCSAAFVGKRCPVCGNEVKDYGKKIECIEADLVEVGNTKKPKATMAEKKEFFAMLEWKRREKGYKPGWAAWKYKERFGVFPRNIGYAAPKLPDLKFENWYRYTLIKNAKRREKSERMVING